MSRDRAAKNQQVKDLMASDDNGFTSMKRWLERQPMTKNASLLPVVGGGTDSAIMLTQRIDQGHSLMTLAGSG